MTSTGSPHAYACAESVVSRIVGDEVVLVDLDRELYFSLNSTGSVVWSGLEAGHDRAELEALLVARGATDDEARDDVDELIDRLLSLGLLTTI